MRAVLVLVAVGGCGRVGFDPAGGLAIEPATARSNLSSLTTFVARGGEPPYSFAVVDGRGHVDGQSGIYRAPSNPGMATVEVTDAAGDTATATLAIGGDYLYGVGGWNLTNPVGDVYRSADGAQWERIGSLPAPRVDGGFVVFEDRMLYIGGGENVACPCHSEIFASDDGITWSSVGFLPVGKLAPASVVADDRILIAGGVQSDADFTSTLWSSTDGVSWQTEATQPHAMHGGAYVIHGDVLWSVAGHEASAQTAIVETSADGGATWSAMAPVPAAGEYHGVTVHRDRVWIAGGTGMQDRVASTTDGTSWENATRLPVARQFSGLVSWRDELWVLGGEPSQPLHSPDGQAWTIAGTFPATLEGMRFVQFTPR